jgi:hypothetical protein
VELSRQSIERSDFPRVADGLDPGAVAEHLRAVAEAVEQLARPGAATATPSSGERVRAIVDAAERSAAELEASARADADRIRTAARADLERLRRLAAEIGDRADAVAVELEEPAPAPAAEAPRPQPEPRQAEPQPQPERSPGAGKAGAGEAPRLIALNMVLDGASREQVAQYLDENFDLEDPGELLDEVWSSAGG